VQNFTSDILVIVVKTKIPFISILFWSLLLIFVLVLVLSTTIQNVFVSFVIVFVVIDEKTLFSSTPGGPDVSRNIHHKLWRKC